MHLIATLAGEFKKGIRTSEFWLLVIAAAYNGAIGAFDPSRPLREQLYGLAIAGLAAVWAGVRTWLKTRRATEFAALIEAIGGPGTYTPPGLQSQGPGVPSA